MINSETSTNANMASVLNFDALPVEKMKLDTPPLEEIIKALNSRLKKNFAVVSAEVVDCPDLTQEPFNLAAKGLNGNVSILDIGGPPYLLPLVQREKVYDMRTIPKVIGEKEVFLIGAGAGPWRRFGTNCEMIVNLVLNENEVKIPSSRISRMVEGSDKPKLEVLPDTETTCSLLANLHCSRGEPGKVIKVHCKKRTGELNFPVAIRDALSEAFPNQVIGVGGVFVIVNGKAKQHVMPDFSKTPILDDDGVNEWLKFFEMSAPLSAVGTLVSQDPDLDLRVIHFHSFGKCEGGHYHYDTTPEDVEYLAYFSLGRTLYRLDRPKSDSKVGFDCTCVLFLVIMDTTTARVENLNVEKINLKVPSLQDISKALSDGFAKNFAVVDIDVVECPDLTLPPYNLASKGMGGDPAVVQVGDPTNFININYKLYDFRDVPKTLGVNSSHMFGAGGNCWSSCGYFGEMCANVNVKDDQVQNFTKDVLTEDKTLSGIKVKPVDVNETRFSVIGNLFSSRGLPGKVIRISCKQRTGKDDFPTTIVNSLNSVFTDPIALGVVFLLKNGKAEVHVAPETPEKPFKNSDDLMKWFLLPIVSPPYVAVGTVLTRNPPGWGVQTYHFHGCNDKEGGHFHFDVTPDQVEYEAYVAPAEILCTIDKAQKPLSLFDYEL
ncbi:uncharacterized protein LOC135845180 [Planococcus citri]|uniref:uncharacterized protein LOC135845180 n=1 Tax=Planococcus citri TaxID=170843 RepID=UPI0031F748A6